MFGGLLELSEEDMSVTEVTVRPPLCTPVTELLGNLQSLLVVVDGFGEVSQQIMNISEVTTGPTLSCSILEIQYFHLVKLVKRRGILQNIL